MSVDGGKPTHVARSDEHNYVTEVFIDCAREMSRSEIFGYAEADRGRFDFACVLTRDHSRNLIGQTLTHHAAGIDKDLASLLHDSNGEIPIYLYPHEARSEGRVQEFIHNARSRLSDRVSLLRLFRYPVFDADSDQERAYAAEAIKTQVVDDLLLNILFGRLTAVDIDLFLNGIGIAGLLVAALEEIAARGFFNLAALGKTLGVNSSTLRPRVFALVSAGMLDQGANMSVFRATPRARVFLRICHLLLRDSGVGVELAYILDRVGLGAHRTVETAPLEELIRMGHGPAEKRMRLVSELLYAKSDFGITISGGDYLLSMRLDIPESPNLTWVGR